MESIPDINTLIAETDFSTDSPYESSDTIADRLEDEHMESGATSFEQRHSVELCNGCTDTVCCDTDGGWIAGEAYCGSCFQAWKTAGGRNA